MFEPVPSTSQAFSGKGGGRPRAGLTAGSPSKRVPKPRTRRAASAANEARLRELDARFGDYLEQTAGPKSPQTICWEQRAYALWRRFLEEGLDLPSDAFEARLAALDDWAEWNRRRGVSPITVNSYWRGLRPFFSDWERREEIANPFRRARAPRFQPAPPKALTQEQCRRILLTAANVPAWTPFQRARNTALLAVMLYAGLRRAEALALLNGDVDLTEGTLRVVRGKGRYGGKTRVAEIGPELKRILSWYVRERRRTVYRNRPEFFPSFGRAAGPLGYGAVNHLIRVVADASGVKFSAHVLRHSFVTHLLRAGVSLYVVRDLAGHANISSTLGYTRVFDEDRRRGIQKLSFR